VLRGIDYQCLSSLWCSVLHD